MVKYPTQVGAETRSSQLTPVRGLLERQQKHDIAGLSRRPRHQPGRWIVDARSLTFLPLAVSH